MSQVNNQNPQVPINNQPNLGNVNEQPGQNVQNGQPNPDNPPEFRNARPAKPGILSRINAFLFGTGTTRHLGMSYLGTLALGTGVAAIASGGVALIGAAIGLGVYAGIRSLVSFIQNMPAPAPRVPENNLPNANPQVDAFNTRIANDIVGDRELTGSLKNAADSVVSQMRERFGEDFVPQGATLAQLLGEEKHKLANEIKSLNENVDTQKMQELVEKHMRTKMANTALENAFKPLCGQNANIAARLRAIAVEKDPQLLEDLKNAQGQQAVEDILNQNGRIDQFRSMVDLFQTATAQRAVTKTKMLSAIARNLNLDPDAVVRNVNFGAFENRLRELESAIVRGQVAPNAIEQSFSTLADDLAKLYTDAFRALDADVTFPEETKKALKMGMLKSHPSICSMGIEAGKNVDVTDLKMALERNMAPDAVHNILSDLGVRLNEALKTAYGEDAWVTLNRDHPRDIEALQEAAFLAMLAKEKVLINNEEKTLLETLRSRNNLDVFGVMRSIQDDARQSETEKRGAKAIERGYSRLTRLPEDIADFEEMQRPLQIQIDDE